MFRFFRKAKETSNFNSNDICDFLGVAQVPQFNEYLHTKSFDKANILYQQSPWYLQSLIAEGSGLAANNFKLISEWYTKDPDNFVACLMWGVALTGKAWRVRGAGLGSSVPENDAETFSSILNEALQAIDKSDRLNNEHAETCVRAIRACMGLGIDINTTFSYFNAGKSFAPEHLHLHLMMANYLTPKWRGSIETLHSFAMENYEKHPSGNLVVLPLFAIVEEAIYYSIMDQKKDERNVWQSIEYISLVENLFNDYSLSNQGNASVLSPIVFNYFSFIFYKQNRLQLAKQAYNGMQNYITSYPWQYEGMDTIKSLNKLLKL